MKQTTGPFLEQSLKCRPRGYVKRISSGILFGAYNIPQCTKMSDWETQKALFPEGPHAADGPGC